MNEPEIKRCPRCGEPDKWNNCPCVSIETATKTINILLFAFMLAALYGVIATVLWLRASLN